MCGLDDFIGGDLIGLDLGQWVDDVEKFGSIGFYAPPEGGAECRYATALKYKGYHFMNVSARGLGDPEAYLLKPHGVRPVSGASSGPALPLMTCSVHAELSSMIAREQASGQPDRQEDTARSTLLRLGGTSSKGHSSS